MQTIPDLNFMLLKKIISQVEETINSYVIQPIHPAMTTTAGSMQDFFQAF